MIAKMKKAMGENKPILGLSITKSVHTGAAHRCVFKVDDSWCGRGNCPVTHWEFPWNWKRPIANTCNYHRK